MADTDEYRKTTKEFKDIVDEYRSDLSNLVSLVAKMYSTKAGGKGEVTTADGRKVVLGRTDVRQLVTVLLNEMAELKKIFRVSMSRPKSSKRGQGASTFQKIMRVENDIVQFFLNANMGRIDPRMVPTQQVVDDKTIMSPIDAQGNPNEQYVSDSQPLAQYLRDDAAAEIFRQGVCRRVMINILITIYGYANNAVGRAMVNQNKPYVQWNTALSGATPELARAFDRGFSQMQARTNGRFGPNGFRNADNSTLASSVVRNDPALSIEAQANTEEQGKAILKAYLAAAKPVTETKSLTDLNSWFQRLQAARSGLEQAARNAGSLSGSNQNVQTILTYYVAVDYLQLFLQMVNTLHGLNYKEIKKARTAYKKKQN